MEVIYPRPSKETLKELKLFEKNKEMRAKGMKISSKIFNFQFFLSGKKPVENLEEAAKQYGGATMNLQTNELYSNVPGDEYIRVKCGKQKNTLSVFIPSTDNVNQGADPEKILKVLGKVYSKIFKRYGEIPTIEKGLGTWYSEDLQQVVYDNLVIVSVHPDIIGEDDIRFFIKLATFIKKEMAQEAVSITINEALCLV